MPRSGKQGRSVFVSYRRDDSPGHAGRLADRLAAELGHDAVFMDVDAIGAGDDFFDQIERAVQSSATFLAVIGPEWNATRLADHDDFIRFELVTAMDANVPVIPVLVDGAAPPAAADLPLELRSFARRNAVTLTDERWTADIAQLLESIRTRAPQRRRDRRVIAPVALGLALAVGVVALLTRGGGDDDPFDGPPAYITRFAADDASAFRDECESSLAGGAVLTAPHSTPDPAGGIGDALSGATVCRLVLANAPGVNDLATVAAEATVSWLAMPGDDVPFGHTLVGVACRAAGGADVADGYSGVVTDAGQFALLRRGNGTASAMASGFDPRARPEAGQSAIVRLECRSDGARTTLALLVDGAVIARASDDSGLADGDVAIELGHLTTDEADVRVDELAVYAP